MNVLMAYTQLFANTAIYGMGGFGITGLLLIPVVAIEAYILSRWLHIACSIVISSVIAANLVSTYLGGMVIAFGVQAYRPPILIFCLAFIVTLVLELPIHLLLLRHHRKWRIFWATVIGNSATYLLLAIWMFHWSTVDNPNTISRTLAYMRAIGTSLGSYQVDTGHFPLLSGGGFREIAFKTHLVDGMTTDYYEGAWKDVWGQEFYYAGDREGYTLKSFGKDRTPGGTGEFNSDILYINGRFVAPLTIIH